MLLDIALFTATTYIVSYEVIKIKDKVVDTVGTIRNKGVTTEYDLEVGYDIKNRSILVNMKLTPHLLVCGLSGQGKSKLVEFAVKDKLNVVILNAFEEDFTSCNCKKIKEIGAIEEYLKMLLEHKERHRVPLYIVIDELISLSINKKITNYIIQLLAVGRHYNLFVVGISQRGLKTELSYKDLFNARLTFRQVEPSSYRAVLGAISDDISLDLKQREFIMLSDNIYEGKTYDIT